MDATIDSPGIDELRGDITTPARGSGTSIGGIYVAVNGGTDADDFAIILISGDRVCW
jgi:hypothetical protein